MFTRFALAWRFEYENQNQNQWISEFEPVDQLTSEGPVNQRIAAGVSGGVSCVSCGVWAWSWSWCFLCGYGVACGVSCGVSGVSLRCFLWRFLCFQWSSSVNQKQRIRISESEAGKQNSHRDSSMRTRIRVRGSVTSNQWIS